MKFIYAQNFQQLSQIAGDMIEQYIVYNPNCVLGLATGSTPLGLYKYLIAGYTERGISYHGVTTFNLDEYVGLSKEHEQSYYSFMNKNLFQHIRVNRSFIPDATGDLAINCKNYDSLLQQYGPIDIQVLGIGANGHIGFNEPGTSFKKRTHVVQLQYSTLQQNARFFDRFEYVPRKAITMGIQSIMEAKQIMLLISGETKEDVLKRLQSGRVTEDFPASILWKHPNVTVIIDKKSVCKRG